jgi:predicted nucleic acid-binding protein
MTVLDSSFLIAFYNERDGHHQEACVLMEQFLGGNRGRGLLLEYVFLEIMTVLLLRRNLAVASRVGQILLEAEELEFMPCSEIFLEAWDAFRKQRKTRLSFVDAAVIAAARNRTGGQILSFDEEFRKLGGLSVNSR